MSDTNPSVTIIGMEPSQADVLGFLQLLGHPLVSVSIIHCRTRNTVTSTVTPDQLPELAARLVAKNSKGWNCYVRVGSTRTIFQGEGEGSAPGDADISAQTWVHVDKDMPKRELTTAERSAWMNESLPMLEQAGCTIIVDSGNGLQGWKQLSEGFALAQGDADALRTATERNVALLVACDEKDVSTRNVSRLLRIPGTINWPTDSKLKFKRVPVLSRVVSHHPERVFAAADLPRMPVPEKAASAPVKTTIDTSARNRTVTPESLRTKRVDEKIIALCLTPWTEGGEYHSRSEQQFAGSCGLVRAGVSDEDHYAMLLSADWPGLSESVLDKRSGAEKYAIRQIERAQEDAVNPILRELNDRYFVVKALGGKFRVCHEVHDDELDRYKLVAQQREDFAAAYMNCVVNLGPKKDKKGNVIGDIEMPAGDWWLRHPQRRQFDRVVFKPSGESAGEYNLWRGWSVEPQFGATWELAAFYWHIYDVLCRGNLAHQQYLIRLLAYWVQNPAQPGHVAVAIRGKKGCGKGIFWREFGGLWGRHFLHISNPKYLVGDFNAHLRDAAFVFADECFYAGDKKHESILKTIVTEPTIAIEAKGVDVEQYANRIKLGLASNADWVVPATDDERRYFMLSASSRRIGDRTYFKAMSDFMENGGRAALLHDLLNLDLTDFDPRDVPKTDELAAQVEHGRPPELIWLDDILDDGALPDVARSHDADFAYSVERTWNGQRYDGLWEHAIRCAPALRYRGWNSLSTFLRDRGCDTGVRCNSRSDDRQRGVRFPPLRAMREKRDNELGRSGHPWKGGIEAQWQAGESVPDSYEILTGKGGQSQ